MDKLFREAGYYPAKQTKRIEAVSQTAQQTKGRAADGIRLSIKEFNLVRDGR